jgi:iron complex outermembrane receptor protein
LSSTPAIDFDQESADNFYEPGGLRAKGRIYMNHQVKTFAFRASVSMAAMLVATPVLAQAPAEQAPSLGDIIVTARRSSENLQKVPVAVSVLDSEVLEKQRITGARDLQYSTPSLVVSSDPLGGSTAPVFQLRGQIPAQGSDDTVVTYVGDVPVNSRAFAGGLFDLQSVQVIRGPQGTLFGKNSTGGAVIFTPRKADTDAVSGFIDTTVGNYSYFQAGAGVNVPVVPGKLGVRLSGQLTRQDGFVTNISGPDGADKHQELIRLSVVATPTPELTNELFVNYFRGRQHQNPLIFTDYSYGVVAFIGGPSLADAVQAEFDKQQALGPRKIDYSARPNNDDLDATIITNTTSYDFGNVTLKNIFGYYNLKPKLSLSQTSTNTPLVDVAQNKDQNSFTEELQLAGETDSLKWIIGGFFSRDKTVTTQRTFLFGGLANRTYSTDRYVSKALFAQGTYDLSGLGLNGLKFTAGLRHTWDKRTGYLLAEGYDPVNQVFVPDQPADNTRRYKNWSWTVGLDYQVNSDLLLYAVSRHSYKAGGLNLVARGVPDELLTYEPEKLTDIEIGAKATVHVGDAVIRTNVAAYRGWYKNIHFQQLANCGSVATFVINAAKGSPKGLEFEFDAALTRNLRVGGFYNRTLGKFDRFALVQPQGCTVIGAGVDLNGATFGNIAKDSAGLNASYTLPLQGDEEELVLSGNWYLRGDRQGMATGGVNSAIEGYQLFNARLDYNRIGGSAFSAGIWIRNIGNKLYVNYRNDTRALSGYNTQSYGDPETYGIDLKYRF